MLLDNSTWFGLGRIKREVGKKKKRILVIPASQNRIFSILFSSQITTNEKQTMSSDDKKQTKKKNASALSKKSATTEKPEGAVKPKHKHKRKYESNSQYIFTVLKQVHPELEIGKKAMRIMDQISHMIIDKAGSEAGRLCKFTKRQTMSNREVECAAPLWLTGELSKHGVKAITKAVTQYDSTVKSVPKKPKKTPAPPAVESQE